MAAGGIFADKHLKLRCALSLVSRQTFWSLFVFTASVREYQEYLTGQSYGASPR